jgi:hypothetical protein
MDVRLSLHGVDRLLDAYSRAPAMVGRTMRKAVEDSLELVKEEARASHRFQPRTGRLAKSVEKAMTGNASGIVFLNEAVAPHAVPIHDGSRPHVIIAKNSPRPLLRWVSGSRFMFKKQVNHPGTRPDPFLHRAADSMAPMVQTRLELGVEEALSEAGL